MMKHQAAGLLISLWVTTNAAYAAMSSETQQKACSIELGKHRSPHGYLVALVKNTKEECDDHECTAKLSILQSLDAGDDSTRLTSIEVRYSLDVKESGTAYPKGNSVGVFIPADDAKSFLLLTVNFPALPTVLADYERAADIARSTGSLHCHGAAPRSTNSSP